MSLDHKITPALKIELVQNHPGRRLDRVPDNFAQGRLQAEVHQVGSPHSKGTQTRPHTTGACGLTPLHLRGVHNKVSTPPSTQNKEWRGGPAYMRL